MPLLTIQFPRSAGVLIPRREAEGLYPGLAAGVGRLQDELRRLARYPGLVIDEVGCYLPFDPVAATPSASAAGARPVAAIARPDGIGTVHSHAGCS